MNQIIVTGEEHIEPELRDVKRKGKRRRKKQVGKTCAILLLFTILLFILIYNHVIHTINKQTENTKKIAKKEYDYEVGIRPEIEKVMLGKIEEETIHEIVPVHEQETRSSNMVNNVAAEVEENADYIESRFCIYEINDEIYARIKDKSYPSNAVTSLKSLRYIKVLHIGFDGQTHEGELIVNASIANDILEIFKALYEAKYEIEKIKLVDEYNASDELSMEDNNTSAFNNRNVGNTSKVSKHAYGLAIDINPKQNPYVHANGTCEPASSRIYCDRTNTNLKHMINKDDLCYKLFISLGFRWGGNFIGDKDYQHFYK